MEGGLGRCTTQRESFMLVLKEHVRRVRKPINIHLCIESMYGFVSGGLATSVQTNATRSYQLTGEGNIIFSLGKNFEIRVVNGVLIILTPGPSSAIGASYLFRAEVYIRAFIELFQEFLVQQHEDVVLWSHDWMTYDERLLMMSCKKYFVFHSTSYDRLDGKINAYAPDYKREMLAVNRYDRIFAVGGQTVSILQNVFDCKRAELLPNSCTRKCGHVMKGVKDDRMVAIVCRTAAQKDPRWIGRLARCLKVLAPDVMIHFGGMKGDDKWTRPMRPVRGNLVFHGRLTKPDVYDLMSASKLFLLGSRFEPHGMVFNEANMCGTLFATRKSTSMGQDLYDAGKVGWLEHDPLSAAKQIVRMLEMNEAEYEKAYSDQTEYLSELQTKADTIYCENLTEVERLYLNETDTTLTQDYVSTVLVESNDVLAVKVSDLSDSTKTSRIGYRLVRWLLDLQPCLATSMLSVLHTSDILGDFSWIYMYHAPALCVAIIAPLSTIIIVSYFVSRNSTQQQFIIASLMLMPYKLLARLLRASYSTLYSWLLLMITLFVVVIPVVLWRFGNATQALRPLNSIATIYCLCKLDYTRFYKEMMSEDGNDITRVLYKRVVHAACIWLILNGTEDRIVLLLSLSGDFSSLTDELDFPEFCTFFLWRCTTNASPLGLLLVLKENGCWRTENESERFANYRRGKLVILLRYLTIFNAEIALLAYVFSAETYIPKKFMEYITTVYQMIQFAVRMTAYMIFPDASASYMSISTRFRDAFSNRLASCNLNVYVMAFGSRGDVQPMQKICDVLRRTGLTVIYDRCLDENAGLELLRKAERGDVLEPGVLALKTGLAASCLIGVDDTVIAAPHIFSFKPGKVNFIPHPPSDKGGSVRLKEPFLDVALNRILRNTYRGLTAGGYALGSPHTSDGLHSTRRLKPHKSRLAHIAFKSSSKMINDEIASRGMTSLTGDHVELARGAEKVYYHGGAGTRLSIIAGGAVPISLDDSLDRSAAADELAKPYYQTDYSFLMVELLLSRPMLLRKWLRESDVCVEVKMHILYCLTVHVMYDIMYNILDIMKGSMFFIRFLFTFVLSFKREHFLDLAALYRSSGTEQIANLISYIPTREAWLISAALRTDFAVFFSLMFSMASRRSQERLVNSLSVLIIGSEDAVRVCSTFKTDCELPKVGTYLCWRPVTDYALPWSHVFIVISGVKFEVGNDPLLWQVNPMILDTHNESSFSFCEIPHIDPVVAASLMPLAGSTYSVNNNCATYVKKVFEASYGEDSSLTKAMQYYVIWAKHGIRLALFLSKQAIMLGLHDRIPAGLLNAAVAYGNEYKRYLTLEERAKLLDHFNMSRQLLGVPTEIDLPKEMSVLRQNALYQKLIGIGPHATDRRYISNVTESRNKMRSLHMKYAHCYLCQATDITRDGDCSCSTAGWPGSDGVSIQEMLANTYIPQEMEVDDLIMFSVSYMNAMDLNGGIYILEGRFLTLKSYTLKGSWPGCALVIDRVMEGAYCLYLIDSFAIPEGTTNYPLDMAHVRGVMESLRQAEEIVEEPIVLVKPVKPPFVSYWRVLYHYLRIVGPLSRFLDALDLIFSWVENLLIELNMHINRILWLPDVVASLRNRHKTVWAMTTFNKEDETELARSIRKYVDGEFSFAEPNLLPEKWSADGVLTEAEEWLKSVAPEYFERSSLGPQLRKLKVEPVTNAYLQGRTRRVMDQLGALRGLNTATRFSTETEARSIARYDLASTTTRQGEIMLGKACDHFAERYQDFFANTDLWTYKMFCKNLIMKYGPGPLLEGAKLTDEGYHRLGSKSHMKRLVTHGVRYRREAKATGLLDAIDKGLRDDLTNGRTHRYLHGLFPKAYVDYVHKLDANPTKMRTITPMFMRDHMLQAKLCGDLNRRSAKQWRSMPFAVGMPMTAIGYNYKFRNARNKETHVDFDFSAADAHFSGYLLQQIARLRSIGYVHHPQGAVIAKWLSANYKSLSEGAIYSYITGKLYIKAGGASTGQFSVILDNSLCVELTMLAALHATTQVPMNEVLEVFDLINMSDDGTLHGPSWMNEEMLVRVKEWILTNTGQVVNFGGVLNKISGLKFCKKSFVDWCDIKEEPEMQGLVKPEYAIVHDRASIIMRQTAVPYKCDYRTLMLRCSGHALLTAHQKDVYDFISAEASRLRTLIVKQQGGTSWLKHNKFPSYRRVLQLHYAPLKQEDALVYNAWDVYVMYETGVIKFISQCRDTLRLIGGSVGMGERPGLGRSYPMLSRHRYAENFIYYASGQPTDLREISNSVKYSPVGVLCSYDIFANEGPDLRPGFREASVGAMQLTMALISANIIGLRSLNNVPVLRLIWQVYRLYYFDMNILFGLLSGVIFLGTGQSSLALASLIPRDPWLPIKKLSYAIVDAIPPQYLNPIIPLRLLKVISDILEDVAMRLVAVTPMENPITMSSGMMPIKEWAEFGEKEVVSRIAKKTTMLITAPTGSGKTMGLLYHLIKHVRQPIQIVLPRKALVEAVSKALKLTWVKKGVPFPRSYKFCCTSSHLATRIRYDNFIITRRSILVIDEAHETDVSNYYLRNKYSGATVIGMTATPTQWSTMLLGPRCVNLMPNISRKHQLEEFDWSGYTLAEALVRFGDEMFEASTRILVICGTMRGALESMREMESAGLQCKVWHARNSMPKAGHIVATTVAEAGVTPPGVTHVFDLGDRIVQHGNEILHVNVDSATASQRAGRAGRTNKGKSIRLAPIVEQSYIPAPPIELFLADPRIWSQISGGVPSLPDVGDPLGDGLTRYFTLSNPLFKIETRNEKSRSLSNAAMTIFVRSRDMPDLINKIALLGQIIIPEDVEDVMNDFTPADFNTVKEMLQAMMKHKSFSCTIGGVTRQFLWPCIGKSQIIEKAYTDKPRSLFIKHSIRPTSTAAQYDKRNNDRDIYSIDGKGACKTVSDVFIKAYKTLTRSDDKMIKSLIKQCKTVRKGVSVDESGIDIKRLCAQTGCSLTIDVARGFEYTILPSESGHVHNIRIARVLDGWMMAAPRGTATYGYWDGVAGIRQPKCSLIAMVEEKPKGQFSSSDILTCKMTKQIKLLRSAFRPKMSMEELVERSTCYELMSDMDCRLKCFSMWEGRTIDEKDLSVLLLPYLRSKPYIKTGDNRNTAEVLDKAYGTKLVQYKGLLDDVAFRDLLIAYSNLSAAVIVAVIDDTKGDGDNSYRQNFAKASAVSMSKTGATYRERRRAMTEAGLKPDFATDESVMISRECVRPLKSLSGWRAHSTGSYCLHLRWHGGHVQPMLLDNTDIKMPRALESEFWGNNNCAVRSTTQGVIKSLFRVDGVITVEPVSLSSSKGALIKLEPENPVAMPKTIHTVSLMKHLDVKIGNACIPCEEPWAHRASVHFKTPHKCELCMTLKTLSGDYGLLTTITRVTEDSCSYSIRPQYIDAKCSNIKGKMFDVSWNDRTLHLTEIDVYADQRPIDRCVRPAKFYKNNIARQRKTRVQHYDTKMIGRNIVTELKVDGSSSVSSFSRDNQGRMHGPPGSRWRP